MSYTSPLSRLCDCRCPQHHGYQRTTYNDEGCACLITCITQPMTLLAEQWGCALFLDPVDKFLWTVARLQGGHWEWDQAREFSSRNEYVTAGTVIKNTLSEIATILHKPK